MPFIERPAGFSSETLELLDKAMMRMWLDHTAVATSDALKASVKPALAPNPQDGETCAAIADDNSQPA